MKHNIRYLTTNIHDMLLILDLTGYSGYITLRQHDKFLKKYSISKYLAIIKSAIDLQNEFIIKNTPSAYAFLNIIDVIKSSMNSDNNVPIVTETTDTTTTPISGDDFLDF